MRLFCTLLSSLTVLVLFIPPSLSRTPITVDTKVGRITGVQEYMTIDGQQKIISQFWGIPYAETTAGKNRFMKPVPKAPFQSTFIAQGTPMACYPYAKEYVDFFSGNLVPGFSEDCLTLNIYVPHAMKSTELLPVMIWIHGGGFISGAASNYHPEVLCSFGNIILVTINYRLGMFGFLRDLDGRFPGNQGLWDQQLAIKWVHDNIESFLGYKDEITIFGESAGGASVLFQALYPGNRGLFKRVIAESGSPLANWAIQNVSKYEEYITEMNCLAQLTDRVQCMQAKTPLELFSNKTTFAPVLDNDFLVGSLEEIVKGNLPKTDDARDFFASVDIIVGANSGDGGLRADVWEALLGYNDINFNISRDDFQEKLIPWVINDLLLPMDSSHRKTMENLITFMYTDWEEPDDYVSIGENVVDMTSDVMFFAPGIEMVRTHAQLQQGRTFFYEFALQTDTHILYVPSWFKGANHLDEIPYVFGTPLRYESTLFETHFNFTSEEMQVSRAAMVLWSNFAKSGNPNIPMDTTQFIQSTWPEYTLNSQQYMRISNNLSAPSVRDHFHAERMVFWTELFPRVMELHDTKKEEPEIFHFDPTDLVG